MGKLRDIARQIKRKLTPEAEHFLSNCRGVIHVGANTGQEKVLYRHYNLNVIWIEPIPEIFKILKDNIQGFAKQHAYQYLITDKQGTEYEFNIANNAGQSSSILELNEHRDIWPNIVYEKKINLISSTLSAMIEKENIDIGKYDTLIMDTQGTELLVLKGAGQILKHFRYIKTEAADFEAYKNCCQLEDLNTYLAKQGFREISKEILAIREQGGKYYDVLYQNLNM